MKKLILAVLALIIFRVGLEYETIKIFIDNSYETKEEIERLKIINSEHEKIDEENKKIIFESKEKERNKEKKPNVNLESKTIYIPNGNFLEDDKAYEQCLSDDGNYCEE